MSALLRRVYASAPSDSVIIQTLEIKPEGADPIRVCTGFQDRVLTLEDLTEVSFTAGPIIISKPKKDVSGQQNLNFSIPNVTGVAQEAIDGALEDGSQVPVIYREFVTSDLSGPQGTPLTMVLTGGQFDGIMLSIEASYYDLLNTAWPRNRYTAEFAPGLKYI